MRAVERALRQVEIPGRKADYSGKVRDIYALSGDQLLFDAETNVGFEKNKVRKHWPPGINCVNSASSAEQEDIAQAIGDGPSAKTMSDENHRCRHITIVNASEKSPNVFLIEQCALFVFCIRKKLARGRPAINRRRSGRVGLKLIGKNCCTMRRGCKSVVISVNVNNKRVAGVDLAPQLLVKFSAQKTSAGLDVRII